MSFVRRYDEDTSAPSFGAALRDFVVRAVLPAIPWWGLIVAIGWVIMHPLHKLPGEVAVNQALQSQRTPTLDAISHAISFSSDTWSNIALTAVCCLVLLAITRRWWEAVIPALSIGLQASVFVLATWLTDRPRPEVPHLDPAPPTSGYPSGHVGVTMALYLVLALFALRIPHRAGRLLAFVFLLMPLAMAWARMYRGMHHLSDVIVGLLNGLVCALLAWHYLRRSPARAEPGTRRGSAAPAGPPIPQESGDHHARPQHRAGDDIARVMHSEEDPVERGDHRQGDGSGDG